MGYPRLSHQSCVHEVSVVYYLIYRTYSLISCDVFAIIALRTPLIANSMSASEREFEAAPEEITRPYPADVAKSLENLVNFVMEDPMLVRLLE